MIQVTIQEAQACLTELIQMSLAGEDVVLAKGDKPVVKLVALPEVQQQRRLGGAADVILNMADDFD